MGLQKTIKQSYETYKVYVTFENVMVEGDTISTQTATAYDNADVEVSTVVLDQAALSNDGEMTAIVRVRDGVQADSPYTITVKVETTGGDKFEEDFYLIIKEKGK